MQRPWLLPALPNALGALCEQLDQREYSPSAIVAILRCEPSLLVQTLRLAPAAVLPGAPIDDHLSAAVAVLGRSGLELLISTTLARHLDQYLNARLLAEQKRRWRRALSSALSAKHLAASFDPAQAEIAYLCGLLREVGELSGIAPLQPVVEVIAYAKRPLAELEQALPLIKVVSVAGNLSLDQGNWDGAFVSKLLARHAGIEPEVFERALVAASTELAEIAARFSLGQGEGNTRGEGSEDSLLHPCLTAFLCRRLESGVRLIAPDSAQTEQSPPWGWLAQLLWARYEIAPLTIWQLAKDTRQPVLRCCFTSVGAERAALLQQLPVTTAHAPGRAWLSQGVAHLGVHVRSEASLADQQLLALLGSAGLLCLSFEAEQAGADKRDYVLMGGLPQASLGSDQDALASIVLEVAESVLSQAGADRQSVAESHQGSSEPQLSEAPSTAPQPSGASDLDRLMLRKTVHEIRTPLSVMKTYLGLLKQKMPESDSTHAELGILGEEIDRVNGLLSQLTDSTQAESRQWVSVNQVVTDMLALVGKQQPAAASVQIRTDLDPDLPAIFSLRDRIKQILLNLLKNALEAQPNGGAIEVITRAGGGTPAADSIRLSVRDQGPGLSDAIKARLFEPFNSSKADADAGGDANASAVSGLGSASSLGDVEGANTKASTSRGLGLYIVRAAAASLGGQIRVSSHSGKGTEFVVELPVEAGTATAGAEASAMKDVSDAQPADQPSDHRTDQTDRRPEVAKVVAWGRRALNDHD